MTMRVLDLLDLLSREAAGQSSRRRGKSAPQAQHSARWLPEPPPHGASAEKEEIVITRHGKKA